MTNKIPFISLRARVRTAPRCADETVHRYLAPITPRRPNVDRIINPCAIKPPHETFEQPANFTSDSGRVGLPLSRAQGVILMPRKPKLICAPTLARAGHNGLDRDKLRRLLEREAPEEGPHRSGHPPASTPRPGSLNSVPAPFATSSAFLAGRRSGTCGRPPSMRTCRAGRSF
jgi:hypothetical protein